MVRNLTTLILSGVLGSIVLAGNAEACLQDEVRVRSPRLQGRVRSACPLRNTCGDHVLCAEGQLLCPEGQALHFTLPKLFCHKRVVTCATPVCYYAAATVRSPMPHPRLGSALSLPRRFWSFAKRIRISVCRRRSLGFELETPVGRRAYCCRVRSEPSPLQWPRCAARAFEIAVADRPRSTERPAWSRYMRATPGPRALGRRSTKAPGRF